MKPTLHLGALALLGLGALCSFQAAAAGLANGGFESPGIASWAVKNVGDTSITGWTVVGNKISFQNTAAFGALGVVASEGQQFLDLSGVVGRGGGVRSNAFATTAGQTYRLNFDIGAFWVKGQGSYGDVTVDVWINGLAHGSYANPLSLTSPGSDWETKGFDFVASSATTVLEFRSSTSLSSSDLGVGLDNVRMTEVTSSVPEPGSAALALTALACLALHQRRRRVLRGPGVPGERGLGLAPDL